MVGSAYGDSLGAATEFLDYIGIKRTYGNRGIDYCVSFFGLPAGSITDDTQMAIATAKGLISGLTRKSDHFLIISIWYAYLDWLETQSNPFESRAPGSTCLRSLRSNLMGTLEEPLNASNGCGGIMRAHPVGLAYAGQTARAFQIGMETAMITHGGVDGYIPAGFFAALVAESFNGNDLLKSIETVLRFLSGLSVSSAGTKKVVQIALKTFDKTGDSGLIIDQNFALRSSSAGWYGDEALGVALFAVLRAKNPVEAVKIAVNHSGDTDSTGAIAGAIAGVFSGLEDFNQELERTKVRIEHQELLENLAQELLQLSNRR
jgi:ADP-ribosylglycohydrolase